MQKNLLCGLGLAIVSQMYASAAVAPKIVATPPADAGRGLVRVSPSEIRHYDGHRKQPQMLVSRDNGLTWKLEQAPASYPKNFGGMAKEAPAIVQNPITKEYIRVQPIKGYVFQTQGGLDGKWVATTKDGQLTDTWATDQSNLLTLNGIMRSPFFTNGGKRILIPTHGNGTSMHISDDGGKTWRKSKNSVKAPDFVVAEPHKGKRWGNNGVEGTMVELKDGRIWLVVRTSQDQMWQSFSSDHGDTWTPAEPSRFFGTLTMPTVGRLADGRLICIWTNTMALAENEGSNKIGGEDAFTNRDSLHAAVSSDEGKTWDGFVELILDENRNRSDYGTYKGSQDRGKHQSEFVQLDNKRILVAAGQHNEHRRLLIVDLDYITQTSRKADFSKGLMEWTHHTFIPKRVGHCAYNRKPAAFQVEHASRPGVKLMEFKHMNDPELVNAEMGVDYQRGGATWNFPNAQKGELKLKFMLPKDSGGMQLSLADRLFNACDVNVGKYYANYTLPVKIGEKLGDQTIKADTWYELQMNWNGVSNGSKCELKLNGKPAGSINLFKPSPNGVSYVHMISAADAPDSGVLVEGASMQKK